MSEATSCGTNASQSRDRRRNRAAQPADPSKPDRRATGFGASDDAGIRPVLRFPDARQRAARSGHRFAGRADHPRPRHRRTAGGRQRQHVPRGWLAERHRCAGSGHRWVGADPGDDLPAQGHGRGAAAPGSAPERRADTPRTPPAGPVAAAARAQPRRLPPNRPPIPKSWRISSGWATSAASSANGSA